MNLFDEKLAAFNLTLCRVPLRTLQVNVGRKCNQACRHCHVGAAPSRAEMVDSETAHCIGNWIAKYKPATVDITGGAPELSEFFRYLVDTARDAGANVMERCNLTILEEPGHEDLPEYLASKEVELIASLPCYSKENVDLQRGSGVFEKSISALRKLNAVGYGTALPLHLVYNPLGPKLPAPQAELEADYREVLQREFGIVFTRLLTITNQPIGRFGDDLRRGNELDAYLTLLATKFNPDTVARLMCRDTLSVDWRGMVYDCDFNQMLGLRLRNGKELSLWDVTPESIQELSIRTDAHCLACTAGCGSSCTGALA